MSPGRDVIKIF